MDGMDRPPPQEPNVRQGKAVAGSVTILDWSKPVVIDMGGVKRMSEGKLTPTTGAKENLNNGKEEHSTKVNSQYRKMLTMSFCCFVMFCGRELASLLWLSLPGPHQGRRSH